jgi:hypothetical protein
MTLSASAKPKINTDPTQPGRARAARRAPGGGKTARRERGQARVNGDTRESVRDSARVVVEADCGITVYPPERAGEPWQRTLRSPPSKLARRAPGAESCHSTRPDDA